MDNREDKRAVRRKILSLRAGLSEEERQNKSIIIQKKLMSLPEFQSAKSIYCYVDFREEVSTRLIIGTALSLGKHVAVPKVTGGSVMEFYYIDRLEDLRKGAYGIDEPVTDNRADSEDALVVLPGAVFDKEGGRIGYGGGFYDRYLSKHRGHFTVALAYSVQIVDHIPREAHDVSPDLILTEGENIDVRRAFGSAGKRTGQAVLLY